MSKDVFPVLSEDGMNGATCIVSLQPNDCGRYSYQIIHTTDGTFGSGESLRQAIERATEAAKWHFKYRSLHWKIKRIENELVQIKELTLTPGKGR